MSVDAPRVTFCVIGAGKAGTTWMYEVLAAHSQVTVARAKETMYFDDNFHRGVAWYHSMFPDEVTTNIVGEVSNSYLAAPTAPERIAAYNPGMRLVALLRDPIDRALSNYLFFVRNGQLNGSFDDALVQRPDILDHGFYGRNLVRYLKHFPTAALHLEAFDDLSVASEDVARRVLVHVGADADELPSNVHEHVLIASAPRSRTVAAMVKRGAVLARHMGAPDLVTRVKRGRLPGYLYRRLETKPEISERTAEQLHDLYAPDVALLSSLTGRDWARMWCSRETAPPEGGAAPVGQSVDLVTVSRQPR